MKTFFYILFLFSSHFFIANSLKSQVSNPAKTNPRAVKLYNEGMEKISDNRFNDAISNFLQAIYLDSNYIDAYLSLAGVYQETKQNNLAIEYYEKGMRKDSAATKVFKLPLANNYAGTGNFNRALETVNEYLSNPKLPKKNLHHIHEPYG